MPPINAPKINLIILTFLLKINDTDNNNIKSKKTFIKKSRSTYIFILSPKL